MAAARVDPDVERLRRAGHGLSPHMVRRPTLGASHRRGTGGGDVELRHLQYFVAVAETRHFGRAAERLHMAQSPLSQAIRQLESSVGASLFARTTRRVE